MSRQSITLATIISFSLLVMNFRCEKGHEPPPFQQTFQAAIDIYPLKKAYSLTDTIWLETDLPSKFIFDTKSNQSFFADSGKITFEAAYNAFGTSITSPQNGFCDVITLTGVNTNRQLSQWGTSGSIKDYGCGLTNYTCRIGFKPLQNGTYHLSLFKDRLFESCISKMIPYYATISYKYKNADLGLDIFNSLSIDDKGGNDGIKFYTNKINNKEIFVFKVE